MRTVFCKSTDWKIPLTQFREVLQSDKLLVLRLLLLLHCCLVSVLVSDMQILILLHDGSPLKAFLEIKLLKILDSHPLPPLKKTSAYHIPAFSWQLPPHSSVLEMVCVFFFSQVTMETSWTCQCRPRRLLRHQQTLYLMEATITSCHGMILNRVVM